MMRNLIIVTFVLVGLVFFSFSGMNFAKDGNSSKIYSISQDPEPTPDPDDSDDYTPEPEPTQEPDPADDTEPTPEPTPDDEGDDYY
jgi:hypothetical protein